MAHEAEDAGQTSGAETFLSMFTPSVFDGTPEKDVELFYERAAELNGGNETRRVSRESGIQRHSGGRMHQRCGTPRMPLSRKGQEP